MKRRLLLLSVCLALLLSACSLLPQERERRQAPMLQRETESIYTFTTVKQGTVTETVKATATVRATQSQILEFTDKEAPVAAMFVSLGAQVRAGDVLAQLDTSELEAQIEDLRSAVARKELERSYQKTMDQVALERAQLELRREGSPSARAGKQEAIAALEQAAEAREGQLDVEAQALSLELKELEDKLEASVLRSEMDGIVTKIAPDRRSYTISDLTDSLLCISKKEAASFPLGTEVTVDDNGTEETCTVLSPAQAGLEEDGCRYLRPTTLSLTAASRCTVYYVAAQAEDALYVSGGAIREDEGQSCVYLVGADGLITIQPVELGIAGDGVVQILSGLSLDQKVILSY